MINPIIIPAPLPDIAGHIECSAGAHAWEGADGGKAFLAEIAEGNNVLNPENTGSRTPVIDRRQAFPGEFSVRCGLVPREAAHWKIVLAREIVATLPGSGSRSTRFIDEFGHGFIPSQGFSVFDKRMLPVFLFLIAAAFEKPHEFFVR